MAYGQDAVRVEAADNTAHPADKRFDLFLPAGLFRFISTIADIVVAVRLIHNVPHKDVGLVVKQSDNR